jgi:hypothetical protein
MLRKGAVIADSKEKALDIVRTTFAMIEGGEAKISKLVKVPHRIPVGKCPKLG